jgi:hypothetical protein
MSNIESPHGISGGPPEPIGQAAKTTRRNRWRLKILLAINGLLAVLFVVSRLEPHQLAMLGPPGQYNDTVFRCSLLAQIISARTGGATATVSAQKCFARG